MNQTQNQELTQNKNQNQYLTQNQELYNLAKAAKETMDMRTGTGEWDNAVEGQEDIRSEIRALYKYIRGLTFNERCVAAVGAFLKRNGKWLFKMPSTQRVMLQIDQRDREGIDDFTVLNAEYWENWPDFPERHQVHIYSHIRITPAKSKGADHE